MAESIQLDRNRKERYHFRVRQLVLKYKDRPCVDCGVHYPYYVMQLDHRDPSTKLYSPGQMHHQCGYHACRIELAKCDPVCANCHAARTHERGHSRAHGRYDKQVVDSQQQDLFTVVA